MAAIFFLDGLTAPLLSLQYEVGLGVSPQEMMAVIAPHDSTGAPPGPLITKVEFGSTDQGTMILYDCRLTSFREELTGDGRTWYLRIQDRRWKWREGFPWYDGVEFNQLDDRKKLIPWTVRSPHQLAVMCLTRMGEPEPSGGWNFAGVLPAGLAAPADAGANPPVPPPGPGDVVVNPGDDYLHLGENLPPTGTNPHVSWCAVPAAVALADVCERYGAIPVWNPATDKVTLQRLGSGAGLPDGWPVLSGGAGIQPLVLPERITVVGAPVVFQTRFCFRPVGLDWDQGYYPWTEMSYAPTDGVAGDPWQNSAPPSFPNVEPTTRLNYWQAKDLARQSILRDYQLYAANPASPTDKRIPVPGLNRFLSPSDGDSDGITRVDNRFRIILRPTRPEQVAPRPGDENRIDAQTGQPFAQEVYDGYSKDRQPISYGSIQAGSGGSRGFGFWGDDGSLDVWGNTPARSAFYIPFSIVDPLRQVIRYAAPIYRFVGTDPGGGEPDPDTAKLKPPGEPLVVETGCLVLHPDTCAPVRYQHDLVLGGPGPRVCIYRDDVQAELVSQYDANHVATGAKYLDADAESRATYYAQAAAYAYQAVSSVTVQALGLYPVELSGVVRQVGWSLTGSGYTTTASANSEHSPNVPPYPLRRRAENLPPDLLTAARNLRGPDAEGFDRPGNAAQRR